MKWPGRLEQARFVRRDNRFRAWVTHQGELISTHVPNSGRLGELLIPDSAVWIRRHDRGDQRKTASDLVMVEHAGVLISVDARLPNKLLAEGLADGKVPQFAGYSSVTPEVTVGKSRLDFLLAGSKTGSSARLWVETKSVTLVEGGIALFPDAPTERGRRHLHELMALRRLHGDRVAVAFVIQRPDAAAFAPHPTADPLFAAALREAIGAGVEVTAWRCRVDLAGIDLAGPVAVFSDVAETLDPQLKIG